MRGLFFNAQPTTDIVAHPSGFDREYDNDDFNRYMGVFFSNGVFVRNDPDACKVTASGLRLDVAPGIALLDGGQCHFEPGDGVTISQGDGLYSVMCRRNNAAAVRAFELVAIKGAGAYPAPVRDGDIYDLCLAHVQVAGGTATVTDTREDRDLCGFAALTGQPPYYPPDEANLPYILWLYIMGLPMTEEQRDAVEGNPSLMEIFEQSRIVQAIQPATKEEAEAGVDNSKLMTPKRTREAIDASYKVGDIKTSTLSLDVISAGEYVKCDGRTILRTGYPKLLDIMGGKAPTSNMASVIPAAFESVKTRVVESGAINKTSANAAYIATGPISGGLAATDDGLVLAGLLKGSKYYYEGSAPNINNYMYVDKYVVGVSFDGGETWVTDMANTVLRPENSVASTPTIVVSGDYVYTFMPLVGSGSFGYYYVHLINRAAKTLTYITKNQYSSNSYSGLISFECESNGRLFVRFSTNNGTYQLMYIQGAASGIVSIPGAGTPIVKAWTDGVYCYFGQLINNHVWRTQDFISYEDIGVLSLGSVESLYHSYDKDGHCYVCYGNSICKSANGYTFTTVASITNLSSLLSFTTKRKLIERDGIYYLTADRSSVVLVSEDLNTWKAITFGVKDSTSTDLAGSLVGGVSSAGFYSCRWKFSYSHGILDSGITQTQWNFRITNVSTLSSVITETFMFYFFEYKIYSMQLPTDTTTGLAAPVMYIKAKGGT